MKCCFKRFLFSDVGILVSLLFTTALLAFAGAQLGNAIARKMLRSDAVSTTTSDLENLMGQVDIPAILTGLSISQESLEILHQAAHVSDIYRFRIWMPDGVLIYSTAADQPSDRALLNDFHRYVSDGTVLGGKPVSLSYEGAPPREKAYYGRCYLPIRKDGKVVGVFEVYIDQTDDHALYAHYFFLTESIIGLSVLLAGGFPAFLVYRKMLAHRNAQAKAMYLADHDNLTGIPNRKRLEEAGQQSLALAQRLKTCFAVLLIDLDHFKEVNDTYGHAVGDELLRAFAQRLQSSIRTGDVVGRLGGDEFVILQVGTSQPCSAKGFAKRLMDILSEPYHLGDLMLSCSASIGVSIAPTDSDDWDTLLTCADAALYKAKAEGRNAICFFEPSIDVIFRERRRLESDLRRALDSNAFQLAYQPLFRFDNGTLLGFEALLRWPRDWAPQSPAAFIPVAEESGLIIPIGAWVLRAACKEAASWHRPLKIAVNLSPVQFRHGDIFATIEDALEYSGLDPARLELEVTENIWIQNTDSVLEQLAQLRRLGISIALDDFGTGYSSLTYLWKFPFDVVKIDRSFVTEIETDPKAGAIVNTIVALGKTLEVTVTAEGVETQAQATALSQAGCDQVQGYLFGRPLTPACANALIEGDLVSPVTMPGHHERSSESAA